MKTVFGIRTRAAVLIVLAANTTACDKLSELVGDRPQTPEVDAATSTGEAELAGQDAPEQAESPPLPTASAATEHTDKQPPPRTEQPVVAVSEFENLLVQLSELPDPKNASEAPVEQDNKTAWTHYKAKRWPQAAKFFARVAARSTEWKHPHNLACALAKAGQPDAAHIALQESLRRGGDTARASAKRDKDLTSLRAQPWFAQLIEPTGTNEQAAEPDQPDLNEDEQAPPNCPPGVKFDDQHYCWIDTLAEFVFEEVVFDTPIALELDPPKRPKNHWVTARGKIPRADIRTALGIRNASETHELWTMTQLMEVSWEHEDSPQQRDNRSAAFFWWPEAATPILVIPQKQRTGRARVEGLILAKQTDKGWQATNLATATPKQLDIGGNQLLKSGWMLRFDGLELLTLTEISYDQSEDPPTDPYFCRVRWEDGKLAQACTKTWKETGKDTL